MRQPEKSFAPTRQVILLDEGWAPTLYVAVGLRNAGCAVHILTPPGECEDVKYLGPRITLEVVPPLHTAEYIAALGACLEGRPSASVLALTEEVLYRLWDANPSWLPRVHARCAGWQRKLLRNKAKTSAHVAEAGVRIPAQRPISSLEHAGAAIQELGLPVVAKGAVGRGGSTVRIAPSAQEALDAATEFMKAGDCFLQQYIEGAIYLVGGLFHEGEPIRIYAGEKLELTHRTGPSLRLLSVRDPALLETALGAFRSLRWSGLASMDIVRRLDGKYYFIEFNPRPWGSISAAAKTGVDLFGPLAELLAGGYPAPDLSFAEGITTTIFPQTAEHRLRSGTIRSLAHLLREPRIWLDAPWQEPGLTLHLSRGIWWKWRHGALARKRMAAAPAQSAMENLEKLAPQGEISSKHS